MEHKERYDRANDDVQSYVNKVKTGSDNNQIVIMFLAKNMDYIKHKFADNETLETRQNSVISELKTKFYKFDEDVIRRFLFKNGIHSEHNYIAFFGLIMLLLFLSVFYMIHTFLSLPFNVLAYIINVIAIPVYGVAIVVLIDIKGMRFYKKGKLHG